MGIGLQFSIVLGDANFAKEVSPLSAGITRVRWAASVDVVERVASNGTVAEYILFDAVDIQSAVTTCGRIARAMPDTKRIGLIDVCNLKLVRELLATGMVHEFLYRPVDRQAFKECIARFKADVKSPAGRDPSAQPTRTRPAGAR
jgi:hypothetical protein